MPRLGPARISPDLARRRAGGAVLLVGAAVVAVALAPVGPARLFWVGLMLGVTYLVAAAVRGRGGPLWAPALVLACWGGAVALWFTGHLREDFTAVAVAGLGVGAVLAALLPRVGVVASPVAIGVTVLLIGLLEGVQASRHGVWDKGWAYAVLPAAWGLWQLRPEPRR